MCIYYITLYIYIYILTNTGNAPRLRDKAVASIQPRTNAIITSSRLAWGNPCTHNAQIWTTCQHSPPYRQARRMNQVMKWRGSILASLAPPCVDPDNTGKTLPKALEVVYLSQVTNPEVQCPRDTPWDNPWDMTCFYK